MAAPASPSANSGAGLAAGLFELGDEPRTTGCDEQRRRRSLGLRQPGEARRGDPPTGNQERDLREAGVRRGR